MRAVSQVLEHEDPAEESVLCYKRGWFQSVGLEPALGVLCGSVVPAFVERLLGVGRDPHCVQDCRECQEDE